MLKQLSAFALLAAPVALVAQPVPPGVEVDRVGIAPGETVTFSLAPGTTHQLLRIKEQGAAAASATLGVGEIRVSLANAADGATLKVENATAMSMRYSILADYDGDGGFIEAGAQNVAAGETQSFTFGKSVAKANVGDFSKL